MTKKILHWTIQIGMILLPLFLFGGCSHMWHPGSVSPVTMETVGPLGPNLSVHLVNNQPLTERQLFATDLGHSHFVNYKEWTDSFIRYWGDELTKRGVSVGPQSRNTIYVKLDGFSYLHIFMVYRVGIKIHLSGQDNLWSKEIEEWEGSGSLYGAFSNAFQLAVEKLMQNKEVLNRMKP